MKLRKPFLVDNRSINFLEIGLEERFLIASLEEKSFLEFDMNESTLDTLLNQHYVRFQYFTAVLVQDEEIL